MPAQNPHLRLSSFLNSVFSLRSIHDAPTLQIAICGRAASSPENPLHVSTIRETVVCPACQLSQYERGNGKCRRCRHSLGLIYIEIFLSSLPASLNSQQLIIMRLKVGGLIRRLRFRRGITQAALASITGINRTYLSRAENGQVMPSVESLMQILSALGVDKILLRVRSSST
jgi:DNA-binding XRE family transcriptional regulator